MNKPNSVPQVDEDPTLHQLVFRSFPSPNLQFSCKFCRDYLHIGGIDINNLAGSQPLTEVCIVYAFYLKKKKIINKKKRKNSSENKQPDLVLA